MWIHKLITMNDRKSGYYECLLADGKNRILYWSDLTERWTSSGSAYEFQDVECLSICEIDVRVVADKLRDTLNEIERKINALSSIEFININTLVSSLACKDSIIQEIKELLAQ